MVNLELSTPSINHEPTMLCIYHQFECPERSEGEMDGLNRYLAQIDSLFGGLIVERKIIFPDPKNDDDFALILLNRLHSLPLQRSSFSSFSSFSHIHIVHIVKHLCEAKSLIAQE